MCARKLLKDNAQFRQNVALRLREIRKNTGLTQANFAKRIGFSVEGYAKYERNIQPLSQKAYFLILKEYGEDPYDVVVSELLGPNARIGARKTTTFHTRFRQLKEYRETVIQKYKTFSELNYSHFTQRLMFISDQIFSGATIAFAVQLFLRKFINPVTEPLWNTDWLLFLSFATFTVLMPFEIWSLVRFHRWCRPVPKQ